MAVPKKVTLENVSTNPVSVQLLWEPVKGASKYEILCTTDKDASYQVVGSTTLCRHVVPQDFLTARARYAFAVRAIADDGTVSQRSVAVLTTEVAKNNAKSVTIPFTEEFKVAPSPDVFVEEGPFMRSLYTETPPSLKPSTGAQLLLIGRALDMPDPTLDPSDPFGAKQAYARIGFQHLDLTKETGKVYMEVYGSVGGDEYDDTPKMRLEVNGNPVPMIDGEVNIFASKDDQQWVWDLSAYKDAPINLALRMVSVDVSATLAIQYIKLHRETSAPDLELMNFAGVQRVDAFGKTNTVYSFVRNKSSIPVASASINVTANGRPVGGTVIENLKPFEMRRVEYNADFSTANLAGELLAVKVLLAMEGDTDSTNNVKGGLMYSLGEKYAMKRASNSGGLYVGSVDEITVQGSRLISDDGGAGLGYVGQRDELLLIKPSDSDKVIAVTVRKASLLGDNDALYINTPMGNSRRSAGNTRNLAIIKGQLDDPITCVSSANDGGMVIVFRADRWGKGKGWELEANEVERGNTLKLGDVTITHVPDTEEMHVEAKVQNVSEQPQTGITLAMVQGYLSQQAKVVAKESIPYLKPGEEITHTFAYEPTVPIPSYDSIRIYVDGFDTEFADNMGRHLVHNDTYCPAPPLTPEKTRISRVTLYNKVISLPAPTKHGHILSNKTLTAYSQSKTNTLQVEMKETLDGLALAVWVDWNGDMQFGDAASGEAYITDVSAGMDALSVPLVVPEGTAPGAKRMRLLLADKGSLEACGTTLLPHAYACDLMLNLEEGNFPTSSDLALLAIATQVVGVPLSEEAEIAVTLNNLSDTKVEQVSVAYSVDGGTPITETATLALEPLGGEAEYTFTAKANLATPGKHTIKAWIAQENANPSNDTARLVVHSIVPSNDGKDYYLHFGGDPENDELLSFSDLAQDRTGSSFCFDFMLNLDRTQFAPICQADGFLMVACDEASGLGANSILFMYDQTKLYLAPAGTLIPGRWQHIVVDQTLFDPVVPRLFVDGEPVALADAPGVLGTSGMRNFKAMNFFKGSIDHLRFWNFTLGQDDAKEIAYKKTEALADQYKEALIAEFSMNEGASNAALFAGKHYALIHSKRTAPVANSIWQSDRTLLRDIHFEGQVGPLRVIDRSHYQVTLPKDADLKHVIGVAYPTFASGKVLYKGQEVTGGTSFDFSDGEIVLYGTLVGYFEHNFIDTVVVSVV